MWGRMAVSNKIGKLRDQGADPAIVAALEGLLYACLDAIGAPAWLNGHTRACGRNLAHTLRRYATIFDAAVTEDGEERASMEEEYVQHTLRFLHTYHRMAYKKAVVMARNPDVIAYGLIGIVLARAGFVNEGTGEMPDRIRQIILATPFKFDTRPTALGEGQ